MDYLITGLGTLLCRAWHRDTGSEMASRADNGIVICDGSEFSFFTKDTEVKVDDRHILVLPKGSNYHFRCRKNGVAYTYNFTGNVPGCVPYNIKTDSVTKCISFAKEIQRLTDDYSKMGLMYRIIGEALGSDKKPVIPEIIRPQLEYIHDAPGNSDLSNKQLASITNISEIYFRKLFVKHMGISPHEYITNLRIERSKHLLTEGHSVSETAQLCGFSNVYYFSAAFKRKVGISPLGFAKEHGFI